MQRWVHDLNALYRREPALHEVDFEPPGFEWVDATTRTRACSPSCARPHGPAGAGRLQFHAGAAAQLRGRRAAGGHWRELLNSDAEHYGGSGMGNLGGVEPPRFRRTAAFTRWR